MSVMPCIDCACREAAHLFWVSERTMRYYVSGDYPPPGPMCVLLALLLSGKITRRDCALAQPVPA
jgi:hypothetical protein